MIEMSNYELVKEILAEVNKDYGYSKHDGFCILMNDYDDTVYVGFGDEIITKTSERLLESFDNPFDVFLHYFYTYNEKAQSKDKAECYEEYLEQKFDEILKSDDEDEILYLVNKAKQIKHELDSLKDDLKWTKEVGNLLFYAKELFNIRVEEEI